MSNSKFATADGAFQYDPSANYENATFNILSVKKCQSIASLLQIRNIKKYKKEELIPLILQKHMERLNMRVVETEDCEGVEETKENNERGILSTALPLVEQLINEIHHFTFNKERWFHGNSVANFFEYKIPKKAIYDHVKKENKIKFY